MVWVSVSRLSDTRVPPQNCYLYVKNNVRRRRTKLPLHFPPSGFVIHHTYSSEKVIVLY
jgi:hypothetical protein